MNKIKKALLLIMTATFIKIPVSPVFAAEIQEYVGNIVYKTGSSTITASVEVSAENKKRTLVLYAYKNGCLEKITADSKTVKGKAKLSASIEKGDADKIMATVIDAFDGNILTRNGVYGTDSTELEYIKVNGEDIGYKDDTDEYWVKYSTDSVSLDVRVKDGTTKATVSDYTLPGNAEINVVSASGDKRNITIHFYKSEDELYKLSGVKYKIGNRVYNVEGFSPSTKQYSITLPDNVMGVTLMPEAMGDVSCLISNECITTIDDVYLGKMYSTGADAYQYKHNARDNYIPIKNEKSTAFVTITSGENSTQYQFDFISKQPRLTSFEYVGASDDSENYRPVFIGGSAINNDYGTILCQDRKWAIGNISKSLIGGSCFMFPAKNKESGTWWSKNTSGTYFRFTANASGTLYILSGNSITNSEYGSGNGWSKGTSSVELPEDRSWETVAKDWNDYDAKCFACAIEHQDDYARAVKPGIAENDGNDTFLYPLQMGNYAYRSFKAGEEVSVYHTGKTGQNAAKTIAVIVWDELPIEEPQEDPQEEDPQGGDEEDEREDKSDDEDVVLDLYFDKDTDKESSTWADGSMYESNVALSIDENNKWTDKGFMVSGASEKATELPASVAGAISSNVFTIEFELAEVNAADGKKCGILSSQNGDFEIYKGDKNNNVYLKWAGNTSALKMPKVSVEQLVGHLSTIVVDKTDTDEAQRIRWYIDGKLIAKAKMSALDMTADKVVLSNSDSAYAGNVVFKSLTVYKKALELED